MKKISPALIALIIILVVISGISVYSGVFPPASVVESNSMQHSDSWEYGVINTGDIVMVKKMSHPVNSVITYVQGRQMNYTNYGDFGNVILYQNGPGFVVIHRAMFYLTWSNGQPVVDGANNASWIHITDSYVLIDNVGYLHRNLVVYINHFVNESGFITMGDHNLATSNIYFQSLNAYEAADQNVNIVDHPIGNSEVVGKAFGLVPWFGLIKLNIMRIQGTWPYSSDVPAHSYEYLGLSIVAILVVMFFPYSRFIGDKNKKNNKK